jgi:hypothetical protein
MFRFLVAFTAFVLVWSVFLRPWLRTKPSMAWFFRLKVVEWIELNIYKKSETLALSRWLAALGGLLTGLTQIDPAMLTMVTQVSAAVLPEWAQRFATALPLLITVAGFLGEFLRRDTGKPVELIGIPADAPSEVKAAVREVDAAVAQAKAVVAEAQDQGHM